MRAASAPVSSTGLFSVLLLGRRSLIQAIPCDDDSAWDGHQAAYPKARRALGHVCHLNNCREQQLADYALFEQFFASQSGGTFVEMGAADGLWCSQTHAFEKALGWTGVLIEADPTQCSRLFDTARPGSRKLCTAVSRDSRPVAFARDPPGTFGTFGSIAALNDTLGVQRKTPTVLVPSAPLGKLLRSVGVKSIDLFTLDLEGSELTALQTFDWSIPVRVWMIESLAETDGKYEHVASAQANARRVHHLMQRHGYVRTEWTGPHTDDQLWVWGGNWTPAEYTWKPWGSGRRSETKKADAWRRRTVRVP